METPKKVLYPHIWLYAKNWYKTTDTMNDLKKIISIDHLCEEKDVSDTDVFEIVLGETLPYLREMDNGNIVKWFVECFKNWESLTLDKWYKDSITKKDIINRCLSVLSFVKTLKNGKTIIDIGEPDSKILPLRKDK